MKSTINKASVLLTIIALISACQNSVVTTANNKEINSNSSNLNQKLNVNNSINNKYSITGKADFPTNKNSLSIKASIEQIGNRATVSLIYISNDLTNPNETIATGLTDSNGNFSITTSGFIPVINKVYILEARKRIGYSSSAVMTVRTYLKHNGKSWDSITGTGININATTTGLTIIDYYDNLITPEQTIGTVLNGNPTSINNVTVSTINEVSDKVTYLLSNDTDPTRFIGYQNNEYFILRENSFNKSYLLGNKSCPNCDLSRENLSNQDLSLSNLKNTNLTNADLKGANLSNANLKNAILTNVSLTNSNLSNADLTGANLTNADLSNAKWINGTTTCFTGSIGKCLFPDIIVANTINFLEYAPSVAMSSTGNFTVVWNSRSLSPVDDFNSFEIYGQRYNSLGTTMGNEFKINTYTTNRQSNSSIAMDNSGNFVVAWQSLNQIGGSLYDIYTQRYNSDGVAQGPEFNVNTYTTNSQGNSRIAMDGSGNFIVTWTSNAQDGSGNGIYAKRYNSLGIAQGPEFNVNTYTTGNQSLSSIAIDNSGNFVVT